MTWTPPMEPEGFIPDPRTYRTPMARDLLREVFDPSGARIISVCGGLGSGKSYAIAQVVMAVAVTRPGARILVGAGSLNLLMGVLHTRCAEVFGGVAHWAGGIIEPRWRFPNRSVAEFRAYSMAQHADEASNPWEGRDCHLLVVDEVQQMPEIMLDHSTQRCRQVARDASGRLYEPTIIWNGRPGAIDHWVREAAALRSKGRRVKILRPRTHDNPLLWIRGADGTPSSPYIENMRAKMSTVVFDCLTQRIPGATMPVDGAIYDSFSATEWPAGNLICDLPDQHIQTWACVDFGVNTTSVVWIRRFRIAGVLVDVIIDEWCPDEDTSTQRLVIELRSPSRPSIDSAVVDPSGQAQNRTSRLVSEVQILRRPVDVNPDGLGGGIGLPIHAEFFKGERGRVVAGVMRVQARLCNVDGYRALLVLRSVWDEPKHRRGIRHTIQQYSWGPDGIPMKGLRGNHADHISDAVRQHVARNAWDGLGSKKTPQAARATPRPRSSDLRRKSKRSGR